MGGHGGGGQDGGGIEDDGAPDVPKRRRRRRWMTALSLTSTLLMAMSAGSAATNRADADRTPASGTAPSTTTTTTAAVPESEPTPPPPDGMQARPASPGTYTVELADCRQLGDDLRIRGSIRNDGTAPAAYRVALTATAPSGQVLLRAYAETEEAPVGESRPWALDTIWGEHDLVGMGAVCDIAGVEVLSPVPAA